MKVLQVINSLEVGGAESLVVNHLLKLKEKGFICDILTLLESDTFLNIKLDKAGISVFSIKAKNLYSPLNILKLKDYLDNYDIIHVHLFPSLYWVVLSNLIFKLHKKLIYTEHSTTNRRRNNLLFKQLDQYVYSHLDRVIAISPKVKNNLEKHLKNVIPIRVIENGVNIQEITKAEPFDRTLLGISRDKIVVLMVARFCYPKDQSTLIKSLGKLPPNYVLVLVGDGENINKCKAEVKQLGLSSRVLFLGIRDDVPALLKMADVMVLSSEYEGLSLSCIEGMSARKPFLASNSPGLCDILDNKKLLFEVGDYLHLSDLILEVTKDKETYVTVSEQSYQNALKYDIDLMSKQYLACYNELFVNYDEK